MFAFRARLVGFSVACLIVSAGTVATAQDAQGPKLVLQVIRLKPGDSRALELALPGDTFRLHNQSGRDLLSVVKPGKPGADEQAASFNPNEDGVCDLGNGLTVAWNGETPGIIVAAAKDAKPETTDVHVNYFRFTIGDGHHILGLRIVVEAE